jgi:molybdate transport system substrate-binding protein
MKRSLFLLILVTMTLVLLAACVAPMTPVVTQAPATQTSGPSPATLTVSAASSLTAAFTEIGKLFEAQTGDTVLFNFGASGSLAQQIEQGAPVDLFASANVGFVDELQKKGLVLPDTMQNYARGQIVLWTRSDSPVKLERIADLAQPEIGKVAIANPDRAPYGLAAQEALKAAGVWEAVQPKLVIAETIQQTHQYAETGNVDAAIGALSLSVPAATGGKPGRYVVVPQELYTPLDQALAVIKGTKNEAAARAFAAFITGPQGREVLQKYGFTVLDGGK